MTKPDTAIIILNWNGERLLEEFLPKGIAATDFTTADIIVADNGSTDSSVDIIRRFEPAVRLLALEKNYGFAGGYNRAIDRTRYKYTILLNSDVAPAPRWNTILHDYMDANPDVGACQPKILAYSALPDRVFEYAGAAGGFIDKNGYPYCRGRIFATTEPDCGQYDTPIPIFWASGAALMIRTELYLAVGGLDEDFFAHMEEIDLCWRVLLSGAKIMAVPSAEVFHLGGGSLPASNPRKTYLNFRNNLLLLHKNLPDGVRGRKLFVRRLLDALAWAKFVATLDFANACAVIRAHRDFAKMRRAYDTHPQVNLLGSYPGTKANILVDYYLRGRRTF